MYANTSLGANLTPKQNLEMKDILYEYQDVLNDIPGTTNLSEHHNKFDRTSY